MRKSYRFVAAAMALVWPLAAANNDANAGAWKMIVLSGPTQIAVPAPSAVTDAGYLAELASIKAAQGQITPEQKKSIANWSGNGVLRWNQTLLELVAASDLPPEPNPDGSYSFPNAANPFAFPQFPFANPPYAARAYSYVTVAQFEALKAAWYYKYLYNRPAPSKVDSGVQALAPSNDLPAYPSEDAVLAGVTSTLLKLLFPTAADAISQKATEQQQAALLSGRASASDIAAGLALGQAVAAVFVARAGSDGMKAAVGSAPQWQALADAATARGEIPWKSLETPPRPPMLPFFGNVKAWMMTPADIVKERPGPPPSTSSQQMAQELAEVRQTVQNLTREQLAIAYKWADGVSSPTPPGHWNFIAESYIGQAQFSEVRAARAFALLDMALHDAAVGCWDVKYTYFNPRPSQLDPKIKTVVGLPNFPAFESGHSTFSAAAAEVLSYLFPSGTSYFNGQKEEAAISRLYGGIHFRSDINVGKDHGKRIADYTVRFAQQDGADQSAGPTAVTRVLDGASYREALAPGSVAAVFQPGLASSLLLASGVPLPTTLGGVSAKFNGTLAAPVFFASADQMNIQIPWELAGAGSATITLDNGQGTTATMAIPIARYAPAIFSMNQRGTGQGAVTIANTNVLAAPQGSISGAASRPAMRGEYVTIYCVGLGPVDHTPGTGAATPEELATTEAPVSVLVNGVSVAASWAGLAPGYVGLYQVNVQLPADGPVGGAVGLAVQVGGVTSNTVTVAVQ